MLCSINILINNNLGIRNSTELRERSFKRITERS